MHQKLYNGKHIKLVEKLKYLLSYFLSCSEDFTKDLAMVEGV